MPLSQIPPSLVDISIPPAEDVGNSPDALALLSKLSNLAQAVEEAEQDGKGVDISKRGTLSSLKPHHRAMARFVATQGATLQQLSERFGLTLSTVWNISNSPLFKLEVKRLQEGLDLEVKSGVEELKALQPKALEIIAEDLHAPDSIVPRREKRKLALGVLDRTGLAPKTVLDLGDKTVIINYNTPRPGDDPSSFSSLPSPGLVGEEGEEEAVDV